ncbi:hypothetical protein CPAR01_07865 [Colletotrichum paranaense]|uniref:Uncharacterized protein n=1 Tax=Colletotrichum paranaense TaxID=1914294 RepID=A0ABQ9SIS7_9PEZI|nr:uncharacterized protein CPAR01_07865 [Colletotrichum paranaense]KAK1537752.1 hypothetical protein CPAR01_07865 [Colletotrichum paranaense]
MIHGPRGSARGFGFPFGLKNSSNPAAGDISTETPRSWPRRAGKVEAEDENTSADAIARSGDVAKDTLFFSLSLTDTHLNNLSVTPSHRHVGLGQSSAVDFPASSANLGSPQQSMRPSPPQGSAHLAIGRQQHPKSASRAIFDGSNAGESPEQVTGEEEIQSFFSSRMTYRNLPIHEVGFGRFHNTWVGLHFHVFKTDFSR